MKHRTNFAVDKRRYAEIALIIYLQNASLFYHSASTATLFLCTGSSTEAYFLGFLLYRLMPSRLIL